MAIAMVMEGFHDIDMMMVFREIEIERESWGLGWEWS